MRLLSTALMLFKVNELQEFWDLLMDPTSGNIDTVLAKPTESKFLQMRLSLEIESQLLFMFHRVPLRQYRKCHAWSPSHCLCSALVLHFAVAPNKGHIPLGYMCLYCVRQKVLSHSCILHDDVVSCVVEGSRTTLTSRELLVSP